MFLASVPADSSMTEPGVGIRRGTGRGETDTHAAREVGLEE